MDNGITSTAELQTLDASLRPTEPVTVPHVFSAFPLLTLPRSPPQQP